MGLSGVEIDLIMRLKDKVSSKLSKMRSKFGGFGKAVAKSLAIGAAAAVGLGIAVGAAALKIAGDFNKAFSTIRSGTGATDEAMIGLKQTFKDTLAEVPDNMADVASAIADVNTELGFTDKQLKSATKAALTAGRVFDADVAGIIKKGADALSVFNRDAEDFESVLDKVAVVSQATGVPIDALLGKVQTFGPVLRNAGFSLEETVALFGNLEASGIDLTRVMPALNANFRRLAEGGVQDLKGAFEEQIELIKNTTSQTDALSLASEIFGAEGAQRMLVAIQDGTLNLDEMTAAMENAEGTIERLGVANLTLGDRFDIIKNKLLVKLQPVLERLFDKVEELMIFIEDHGPQIEAAIRDFVEKSRPFLDVMRSGLEGVLAGVMAFWDFLRNNKPAMILAIAAIGAAIVIAFAGPSLAIAAIVGLIFMIGLLRDNWRSMGNAIIGFVEKMVNGIIQGFAFVADKIGDFIEFHINPFLAVASKLGGLIGVDLPSSIQLGSFGLGGVQVSLPRIAGPALGNVDPQGDFGAINVNTLIVEGSVIRESELAQATIDTIQDAADAGELALA